VNESGTFKIDTAKKPMTMDLTITEGSDAGKAQPGIVDGGGKEAEALSARSRSRVINGGEGRKPARLQAYGMPRRPTAQPWTAAFRLLAWLIRG
jgi:hypothetical protein